MEITMVYWGYIGIMEEKMETTLVWGTHACWAETPSVLETTKRGFIHPTGILALSESRPSGFI